MDRPRRPGASPALPADDSRAHRPRGSGGNGPGVPKPKVDAPGARQAVRILLVEDDLDARDAIGYLLKGEQVELEFAADGEEALKALDRPVHDLVILDLDLPRVHGLEVLRRYGAKARRRVPVVVFSSAGTDQSFHEARRLGAADCVRKPVAMGAMRTALLGMIHRWAPVP